MQARAALGAEYRRSGHDRQRKGRERAAILPHPDQMDRLNRGETHLDRRFAKALGQLEVIQRMRSGDRVPAPVRIHVDTDL